MSRASLFAGLAALWCLTVGPSPALAQSYPAYTYSERDGLPSGVVYGVAQDPDGTILLATRAGVVTFDGREWLAQPTGSPPRPPATRIVTDGEGTLFGTSYDLSSGLLTRGVDRGWTWVKPPERRRPGADRRSVVSLAAIRREVGGGGAPKAFEPGALVATRHHGVHRWFPDGWSEVELPELLGGAPILDCVLQGERLALATERGCWLLEDGTWSPIDLEAVGAGSANPAVCSLAPAGPTEADALWLVGRDWMALYADGGLAHVARHELFDDPDLRFNAATGALETHDLTPLMT